MLTPLRDGFLCGVFFHNHFESIKEDQTPVKTDLSLLRDESSRFLLFYKL